MLVGGSDTGSSLPMSASLLSLFSGETYGARSIPSLEAVQLVSYPRQCIQRTTTVLPIATNRIYQISSSTLRLDLTPTVATVGDQLPKIKPSRPPIHLPPIVAFEPNFAHQARDSASSAFSSLAHKSHSILLQAHLHPVASRNPTSTRRDRHVRYTELSYVLGALRLTLSMDFTSCLWKHGPKSYAGRQSGTYLTSPSGPSTPYCCLLRG
jgi:hypothetical protein